MPKRDIASLRFRALLAVYDALRQIIIVSPPEARKRMKLALPFWRIDRFLAGWFFIAAGLHLTPHMASTLCLPSHCLTETGCIPEFVVLLAILPTMLRAPL